MAAVAAAVTPVGTGTTQARGTAIRSAKAPGRVKPMTSGPAQASGRLRVDPLYGEPVPLDRVVPDGLRQMAENPAAVLTRVYSLRSTKYL